MSEGALHGNGRKQGGKRTSRGLRGESLGGKGKAGGKKGKSRGIKGEKHEEGWRSENTLVRHGMQWRHGSEFDRPSFPWAKRFYAFLRVPMQIP